MPSAAALSSRERLLLLCLWACTLLALPVWVHYDTSAWDVRVYSAAMRVLREGGDPYRAATAIQTANHRRVASADAGGAEAGDPPYSYVYSPLTLLPLRLVARLPFVLSGWAYWILYAAAVLAQLWAGLRAAKPAERRVLLFLAPLAPFFPGLLANGTLLGGNVAYLLYAGVLLAMLHGVRTRRWLPFYAAVLLASCVKAPLLCLVLLAPLLQRGQWSKAAATAVAGVAAFAVQPLLWPQLFRNYLQAVDLQFRYNRDFGCSPAGLFSGFLYDRGIPYSPAGLIFHVAFALPVLAALLACSRRYLEGRLSLQQWLPVALVGVVLLNPRLIEYDVAPLTIPLALLAWRVARTFLQRRGAAALCAGLFIAGNAVAIWSWTARKLLDGPLLVVLFAAGMLQLLRGSFRETDSPQWQEEAAAVAP